MYYSCRVRSDTVIVVHARAVISFACPIPNVTGAYRRGPQRPGIIPHNSAEVPPIHTRPCAKRPNAYPTTMPNEEERKRKGKTRACRSQNGWSRRYRPLSHILMVTMMHMAKPLPLQSMYVAILLTSRGEKVEENFPKTQTALLYAINYREEQ
jgi:hypothetical protein